jgi:hypothetical protein
VPLDAAADDAVWRSDRLSDGRCYFLAANAELSRKDLVAIAFKYRTDLGEPAVTLSGDHFWTSTNTLDFEHAVKLEAF